MGHLSNCLSTLHRHQVHLLHSQVKEDRDLSSEIHSVGKSGDDLYSCLALEFASQGVVSVRELAPIGGRT